VLQLIIATVFLLLITGSNTLSANQEVISDDGREVLLKEDGSWEYRSTDRFTNAEDGRRVRLKEDGSWSYTGETTPAPKEPVRSPELDVANLDIKLQRVVIEKYEVKAQKNTRVKTQTVFYLAIEYPSSAKNIIRIKKDDTSLVEVKDNNGKDYPVLSIESDRSHLTPGTTTIIVVRVNKSPAILDEAKSMEITLKPGLFGLQKAISLSQRINDFEEEDVDGF